ncbi:hypothetical protein K458DRAFT_394070 [Lentithecium fluviatile CBS 122367]|uniref:WW domain-containing protein n=1 Tax=Lentithecium fluviatile CBS 122367 TaxID=1168545 RepID=A0A6G1IMA7_9PLEO|nr:hypothetical protein K458DRAFT_394070 [Lentithecium fluviatile CBS 122367]
MNAYQYTPLQNPNRDIRLVTLLPGRFDDTIRILIDSCPLSTARSSLERHKRLKLKELQATLPPGWKAYESSEGDYIFSHQNGVTTWTHPDPDFVSDLYRARDTRRVADVWFEALSYTWGNEEDPERIHVLPTSILAMGNEEASSSMNSVLRTLKLGNRLTISRKPPSHRLLRIRKNLATALRYLRRKRESRVLWIDSLCINQDDAEERSRQVARMAEIYALAPRVVVWLGKSSSGGQEALETLAHIGSQEVATKKSAPSLKAPISHPPSTSPKARSYAQPPATTIYSAPSSQPRVPRTIRQSSSTASLKSTLVMGAGRKLLNTSARLSSSTNLLASSTCWRTLQRLFDRHYFRRLWIWQEIVLGDNRAVVQCGSEHVPWLCVRRGITKILHPLSNAPKELRVRSQHVYSLAQCRAGRSFSDLMEHTVNQDCMSDHDKVYAILGLTTPVYRERIVPNYTISAAEAYKQAFLAVMDQTLSLELLSRCDLETHQIRGPTWVPDWSTNPPRKPIETDVFFASADKARVAKLNPFRPGQLSVGGIKCATIGDCLPLGLDTARYVTGGSLIEAYTLTLCMHAVSDKYPGGTSPYPTLDHAKQIFTEYFVFGKRKTSSLEDDPYIRFIFEKARGRVLVSSREGHLGLAPPNTRKDDIVAVIFGCSVPMLLRKTPDSTSKAQQYYVVGPVYMHGLMYGEGPLGPLPSRWGIRLPDATHPRLAFWDAKKKSTTFEDPRLAGLGKDWILNTGNGKKGWRNSKTGETRSVDPRCSIEQLKSRGVSVEWLNLV